MEENKEKLSNQIWITRVSRINAEKRLINKEHFVQFINIYYSLFAIICSIISYHYEDSKMGLFTIVITIGLMVSILYLNGQKYVEQARDYRTNYTQLHLLQMKLENQPDKLFSISEEYSKLLNTSSNHITYDYYWTLFASKPDFRDKQDWEHKKWYWGWGVFWRALTKLFTLLIPFIVLFACEAWA